MSPGFIETIAFVNSEIISSMPAEISSMRGRKLYQAAFWRFVKRQIPYFAVEMLMGRSASKASYDAPRPPARTAVGHIV